VLPDEFIGLVQGRAHLSSRGAAEGATRAMPETLGERIPGPLANNLAAQLPQEIGEHLRRTITMAGAGTGERFDREEFISRVAQRERADEPAAACHARVVLEVIGEATGGAMNKVREPLPDDLRALVDAGSTGSME
jgi:uncharacterized protein (DUF2267 family)